MKDPTQPLLFPAAAMEDYKTIYETFDQKFELLWKSWPVKQDKEEARSLFHRLCKDGLLDEVLKGTWGYSQFLRNQRVYNNFEQIPMYLSKFLRPKKKRWKEYLDEKYKPRL